jgi:copper homeostasis protein
MILEIIAGSVEDAIAAERGGATRIELCVDLDHDGLTPPLPLIEAVVGAVHIPARVMLRRRNDFIIHDEADLNELCTTALAIQHIGAEGLVLGFIEAGGVDVIALRRIADAASLMKITFHRAFDAIAESLAAINTLKQHPQVDCILTAGGTGHWQHRALNLTTLQERAFPQITMLTGGGVDVAAIQLLCRATPLRAFHAGRAARENNAVNGRVLEEKVCSLRRAMT